MGSTLDRELWRFEFRLFSNKNETDIDAAAATEIVIVCQQFRDLIMLRPRGVNEMEPNLW